MYSYIPLSVATYLRCSIQSSVPFSLLDMPSARCFPRQHFFLGRGARPDLDSSKFSYFSYLAFASLSSNFPARIQLRLTGDYSVAPLSSRGWPCLGLAGYLDSLHLRPRAQCLAPERILSVWSHAASVLHNPAFESRVRCYFTQAFTSRNHLTFRLWNPSSSSGIASICQTYIAQAHLLTI
jgi:hypothetical protein